MSTTALRNPGPVIQRGTQRTSGGNQHWLKNRTAQKYGCGIIAATDLLLYLHRSGAAQTPFFHGLPPDPIPWELYDFYADRLRKRCLPLLPPFGLNAWVLALGLNRYFQTYHLPYRARWGVLPGELWQKTRAMLSQDIPVILCIGINFPFPKHSLPLYPGEGARQQAGSVRAHYVTVTAMDQEWLQISSWGRVYKVRREDLDRYRKRHSCPLYTNIVHIERR